ncbi:MAG: SDR family oxidoreductase [Dehalococcoidia bacterium]|nr:SDR family oxidoreductase [Dehalococcoidia bacterium]
MRAFVTGLGGFAGNHLAYFLLTQNVEVHGTVRPGNAQLVGPMSVLVRQYEVDLLDAPAVQAALAAAAPDVVFHLAAQASVGQSWSDPEETIASNVLGQLHLLEALRKLGASPRVLIASTAEIYGIPDSVPIAEDAPLRPSSPYAVSKAAQDLMGYQYFASHKLPVIRTRAFNHIGPGQAPGFVTSDFAKQIAEAEAGVRPPAMAVGNLTAQRDFSDVRDVVRAYYWLMLKGEAGAAYNVGSGRAVTVQHILDTLLSMSVVPITVAQDPARYRPIDAPCIYADIGRLRAATGWVAETPLERSLSDVLEYWRSRVTVPHA